MIALRILPRYIDNHQNYWDRLEHFENKNCHHFAKDLEDSDDEDVEVEQGELF